MNEKIVAQCQKWELNCIVAPYEADSQLAYLSRNNLVDAVMTEDSDLFIFGAKNLIVKETVCTYVTTPVYYGP